MKTHMECLRLLIISSLLFNIAIAIQWRHLEAECSSNSFKYRLPKSVADCQHYDIKLVPSIISNEDFSYYGQGSYVINIYQITKNISLHISWILQLNNAATTLTGFFPYTVHLPVQYFYCERTEILTIDFGIELQPELYILNLEFDGVLTTSNHRGFTRIAYQDNQNITRKLLMTNFLWDARRVFPCWDEPALKATFNISVKHPQSYTVLSNMPIREQVDADQENMVWTHFHTTPFIPTHLVGIVIFDGLTSISNDNKFINVWGTPAAIKNLQKAYEAVKLCLYHVNVNTDFIEFPRMDHVAIPPPMRLIKYNWGLYTYEERELTYNEQSAYIEKEIYVQLRIANTVSHQLFRGMISPSWWNYEWLNDGVVTFFALYIIEKFFENTRIMDYFVVEIQQQILSEDIKSNMNPIIREVNTPDEIEYFLLHGSQKKATAIMRMMCHMITDKVFVEGINHYLNKHQFKSATPNDLWTAFEEVSDIGLFRSELYNLKVIMTNWLLNSNYPIIDVSRDASGKTTITQKHFYQQTRDINEPENLWWVPITYTTMSDLNFNETLPTLWLKPWTAVVKIHNIHKEDWIILNLQQTGYYRVNYDTHNWRNLLRYLKSDNYTKIHPINRAQLIDDSYHLMLTGHLDSSIFINLLSYLERERDYIAWYPMKAIILDMLTFFQFPEGSSTKEHMVKILRSVLNDVGYVERNNDSSLTKSLRLLVAESACQLGCNVCLYTANAKLLESLDNPQTISLLWRNWTFCTGMMMVKENNWIRVLDTYLTTGDIRYLEYLTCAEDPIIIIGYIDKLMTNSILSVDFVDRNRIIHSIIRKHATKNPVLDYVLTNFHRIQPYKGVTILEVAIRSIYSLEQFEKVEKFIRNHTRGMLSIHQWSPWWFDENYARDLMSVLVKQSQQIQQEIDKFASILKIPRICI